MSANPFKLSEEVSEETTVEKLTTEILYYDNKTNRKVLYDKEKLSWKLEEIEEYLTLEDILKQIIEIENIEGEIPLIRVSYESALWGGIFEVGNCSETKDTWFVHGITKGYA